MLGSSLALIFGLILLWRRRVPAYINAFTGQSVALAGVAGATGYFGNEPELYWVAAFLLVLKGAVIPALLRRMGRRFGTERELDPYVNTATSLLMAGLLVLFGYAVMRPLVATSQLPTRASIPLAMGLILVSLFVIVTRKKALTQIVGFLMLENGIALLAILGTYGIPLIVELGVFLDALLGFLVMQVFVYRIRKRSRRWTSGSSVGSGTEGRIVATLLLLLTPPMVSAALAALVRPYRRVVGWANAILALVSVGSGLALWGEVLGGRVGASGPGELLRVDALSALLAFGVSVGGALAARAGPGLGGEEDYDAAEIRRFRIFVNLFTFTMLFAVSTNNVGFMWIAIEATTITSAVLIPLHLSKASVEASWKYILLSSVGIALAFAGTVLAYVDFVAIVGRQDEALNWPVLVAAAPLLDPEVMRLAFVFVLVGYGTKAGLAPMHTWLPDAHAEAPAPLSAMMSGVLLAVALYAVIRWEAVANAALGAAFTDRFLLGLGLLSLGMAAFSLVRQHNYKRRSEEHTSELQSLAY